MEQGEGRSQERVEGQGKGKKDGSSSMQGVVNQGGRSQEVAEGQGRGNLFYFSLTCDMPLYF